MQVVPQGIESVNGSDVNMGCTSPLVDSGGVMVCGSPSDCSTSYLLDGNSPAIDTSTSDWASQLVTVRKNDAYIGIPFDHVVLTFGFDTAVSLTSIELDLFLCPKWNIGASYISVYGDEKNSLVFNSSFYSIINHTPSQTSCDFLSTIAISFEELTTYPTWHIVVSFHTQPDTEWVHVGVVRFLGTNSAPVSVCTTEEPTLSMSEGPSSYTIEEPTVYLSEHIPCCMWFVYRFYFTFSKVQQVQQFLVPVPPRASRMIKCVPVLLQRNLSVSHLVKQI